MSIDSWVAVTPHSDDERPLLRETFPKIMMTPDLALAVEGLRIHEHEESFPSEGEEDEEDDMSIPPSEDSSLEDEENEDIAESSDEETVLAPRTMASLSNPVSDDALRARYSSFIIKAHTSLSTLLRSKDTTATEYHSPRRNATQGPMGMESISLLAAEDFANRTSIPASRSSSKSNSRLGKKSHSKRGARSPSKSRSKDNAAQVYALWTAAITAGFLVGFGAGYAWKEYLAGGGGGEDVRRVGCAWCGEGKR
jgi:hypothetical protein